MFLRRKCKNITFLFREVMYYLGAKTKKWKIKNQMNPFPTKQKIRSRVLKC